MPQRNFANHGSILHAMSIDVVVTGATGFLGQRVTPPLIKKFGLNKILFLVWDKDIKLTHTSEKALRKSRANIKYIDLIEPKSLYNLPKSPRLIIHMAANTDTSLLDHRVNDQGVKNLYRAFGKLDSKTHFIHIGTMVAVSGRPNCKNPIAEETVDYPTNEYTRTKVAGENYLIKKCKEDMFKLTILRPNTIYGKGMRKGSLFQMLKKEVSRHSLTSRINWPGRSALIHVDDVVRYILLFTGRKPKPGIPEKYLLYSENFTIGELCKIIYKHLNIEYNPIKLPKIFWGIASYARLFIPHLEKFLTPKIYNQSWRLSIILDDVVNCKTDKAPKLKKKLFTKSVDEVV